MCKKVWAIAKLNLKNIRVAYIITAAVIVGMSSNYIVDIIMTMNGVDMSGNESVSIAWVLWLLPAFASILLPSRNFKRTMNLGGKRDNFFWGSLEVYAILAAVASLVGVIFNNTADAAYVNGRVYASIFTAPAVFGWADYGVFAEFFQQFAFLFLFAAFVHTLTAIQDKWFGWATDVLIIAIISVFTPIAPLRAALAWFFRAILFSRPLMQIPVCMILALAIYSLNKVIFARKAI